MINLSSSTASPKPPSPPPPPVPPLQPDEPPRSRLPLIAGGIAAVFVLLIGVVLFSEYTKTQALIGDGFQETPSAPTLLPAIPASQESTAVMTAEPTLGLITQSTEPSPLPTPPPQGTIRLLGGVVNPRTVTHPRHGQLTGRTMRVKVRFDGFPDSAEVTNLRIVSVGDLRMIMPPLHPPLLPQQYQMIIVRYPQPGETPLVGNTAMQGSLPFTPFGQSWTLGGANGTSRTTGEAGIVYGIEQEWKNVPRQNQFDVQPGGEFVAGIIRVSANVNGMPVEDERSDVTFEVRPSYNEASTYLEGL